MNQSQYKLKHDMFELKWVIWSLLKFFIFNQNKIDLKMKEKEKLSFVLFKEKI